MKAKVFVISALVLFCASYIYAGDYKEINVLPQAIQGKMDISSCGEVKRVDMISKEETARSSHQVHIKGTADGGLAGNNLFELVPTDGAIFSDTTLRGTFYRIDATIFSNLSRVVAMLVDGANTYKVILTARYGAVIEEYQNNVLVKTAVFRYNVRPYLTYRILFNNYDNDNYDMIAVEEDSFNGSKPSINNLVFRCELINAGFVPMSRMFGHFYAGSVSSEVIFRNEQIYVGSY